MSKKNEFDNFDQFAEDYRVVHGKQTQLLGIESDYFAEFKVKEVAVDEQQVAHLPLRILDYGCGDGVAEQFFCKYFPNSQVVGIDISEASIEVAKKRQYPNVEYIPFNGIDIPFESGFFDIIFVAMVLHHIDHGRHAAVLKEFLKVLTPGGRVYIFEHNPFNPVTRYFVNTCVFDEDAHLLYPLSLKAKLKASGFTQIKNSFLFFLPRFQFLKPLLFIENYLRWFGLGGQYYSRAVKQ